MAGLVTPDTNQSAPRRGKSGAADQAEESAIQKDVDRARETTAKMREQGLQKYRRRLLGELETDRKRKLFVTNALMVFSLLLVWLAYSLKSNQLLRYESLDEMVNDFFKN